MFERKIALFIAAALLFVVPISAQEAAAQTPSYNVQKGDNLWILSEYWLQNPERWEELLSLNPWIQTEGRMSTDGGGRKIVLLYPGEEVQGIGGLEPPVARTVEIQQGIAPLGKIDDMVDVQAIDVTFVALLLLVLVIIFFYYVFRFLRWLLDCWREQKNMDPVTAGPPIVEGGILSSNRSAVEERFRQMGESGLWNGGLAATNPLRIGPIEYGTINGKGRVHYADGSSRDLNLVEQAGFRAQFRFSDGAERNLIFLQGCGNDVTYFGQRYEGFTFTPEEEVLPAPVAESRVAHPVRSTKKRVRNSKGNTGDLISVIVFLTTLLVGLFFRRMVRN
jgi:hypothetical protein